MTQHERDTTIQRFNTEKAKMDAMKLRHLPIKRTYDENDMMLWSTLEEFSQRKQWDIIKYNVLNNPLFCRKLHESRSLFNIKRSYITNAAICGNGRIERPGCSDGKGENAPQETVDLLMGMKAKDLVKWMKERRTKVVSPPSGEQGHDEEGCEVLVNRFSAMFKNE